MLAIIVLNISEKKPELPRKNFIKVIFPKSIGKTPVLKFIADTTPITNITKARTINNINSAFLLAMQSAIFLNIFFISNFMR